MMKEAERLNTLRTIIFNIKNFLFGFIQMARLHTGMQAVAYLLLSKYLTDYQLRFMESRVVMGGVVVISTVAFGFIVDDIRDLPTDRILKPNNAIPSGRVSHKGAILLAVLFAACSIYVAGRLGEFFFVITLVNLLLCLSYAYLLRNSVVLSIFIIAYLTGSIILFGSALAGEIRVLNGFISLLIFLFTCAQEILYSVIDHDADRMNGVRTPATVLGINTSLWLFVFFLLLTIIVTIHLGIVCYESSSFGLLMIPCTILPLISAIIVITISSLKNRVNIASKILYITRALSFIAFWSL